MRLWHQAMLPYLSQQHRLGQHRECCALRGLGWGRKHATVDYVFRHPPEWLFVYHIVLLGYLSRMECYGEWFNVKYRGKRAPAWPVEVLSILEDTWGRVSAGEMVYPEHDEAYYQECLLNLAGKGFDISTIPQKSSECSPRERINLWKF